METIVEQVVNHFESYLLILVVYRFVLAILFSRTSIEKGYYGVVTGVMVLITGIAGMLYAIALTTNKEPEVPIDRRYVVSTLAMVCILLLLISLIFLFGNQLEKLLLGLFIQNY